MKEIIKEIFPIKKPFLSEGFFSLAACASIRKRS